MLFSHDIPSDLWLEGDGEKSSRSCTEAANPADLCLPCWSSFVHIMATLVFGQVVTARKAKLACGASKAFLPSVSAPVSGKFI